jgi:adenylosuccinate synthase
MEQGTLTRRIGSTGKGIGAARSERIMRRAITCGTWWEEDHLDDHSALLHVNEPIETVEHLRADLKTGHTVIIEGTQGYGLGLHAGYYPYCTSSDCRAIDFLAMAGLTPSYLDPLTVWPVYRTYPIRVAGNSGPLRHEITWEDLYAESGGHIHPEKTTVTQKVRRVGRWDADLAREAFEANGGDAICNPILMFLDYLFPEIADSENPNELPSDAWEAIEQVEKDLGGKLHAVGTGPNTMIDLAI